MARVQELEPTEQRPQRRRRSRRLAFLGLLAVAAMVASACGGDDSGTPSAEEGSPSTTASSPGSTDGATSTAPAEDEPAAGGTMTFIANIEPRSLDSAVGVTQGASGAQFSVPIYGALVYVDFEDHSIEPWLAESVETTDGGTTWRIVLRDGLKFSDGTPFDAEAIKFNWDRVADPATASTGLATMKATIASYTVVDPLTLEVKLTAVNSQWPYDLASVAAPLAMIGSPTAIKAKGPDFGNSPVGAGPFMVKSYVPQGQLELVRNPLYYDAPRPYLDGLIVRAQADEQQRGNALKAGEVQAVLNVQKVFADQLTDFETLKLPQVGASGLALNAKIAPTDDVRVREALWLAMGNAVLASTVYGGETTALGVFPDGGPFEGNHFPAQDLTAAQALIDEYKQDTGNDVTVTYTHFAGIATEQKTAEIVQQNWQRLKGVKVNIEPMAAAAITQAAQAGTLQVSRASVGGAWPSSMFNQFHSTGGTAKINGWSDPRLDAALVKGRTSTDAKVQVESYREAAKVLGETFFFLPQRWSTYYISMADDVRGTEVINDSLLRFDTVWLDEGR